MAGRARARTTERQAGRWRVVDALNEEWDELVGRSPRLTEVLVRAGSGDDATLHLLLAEALDGDPLAARTVLQAMLGRLVRMAGRDRRGVPVDDYVSAAWCVIVRYPLAARPQRIAANLALDTLKAVHREGQWWPRRAETAWLVGERAELEAHQRTAAVDVEGADDAARVIDAGRRLALIDEPTGRLLEHVYVQGLSGVEVAGRLASTPGSVRVRCSRAVRRLAAHAAELSDAA